ncbi:MAG: 30S ribosomal protein S6 [Candidatus Electrothrix sp. MAN1_4]|nr:30S ribosomal protein S6 [Candidatus Electrothrix sp. MAN1_4]
MRHYETTYILRPNLGEEKFTEIIERTNGIIEGDNGTILEVNRGGDLWGMRKLAYEIKKETQGYYVYMNYAAPGSTIQEIERIFRIDDNVLRYLTVKLDKGKAIDETGVEREKERIAADAAAKAAESEELAQQDEEGESSGNAHAADDKEEETTEEQAVAEENNDTSKQEQQDDSAA